MLDFNQKKCMSLFILLTFSLNSFAESSQHNKLDQSKKSGSVAS